MPRFMILGLTSIIAIYLAACLLPGIHYEGINGLLVSGIILALIILFFRPIIMVVILPLNLLTLGLFGLVVNAWLIQITDLISNGLQITGFWSALGLAIIMLTLNWFFQRLLPSYRSEPLQTVN